MKQWNESKVIKVNASRWKSDMFDYFCWMFGLPQFDLVCRVSNFQMVSATFSMGFPYAWGLGFWAVRSSWQSRCACTTKTARPGCRVTGCRWMPLFHLVSAPLLPCFFHVWFAMEPVRIINPPHPYPSCQRICAHWTHKRRQALRLHREFVWCIRQDDKMGQNENEKRDLGITVFHQL